jgi:hypothetical protein
MTPQANVLPCGSGHMPRRIVRLLLFIGLATIAVESRPAAIRQSSAGIAGVWVLNPALTQKPDEIGFTPDWARTGGEESGRSGGGRGRRGGGGSGGGAMGVPRDSRESVEDATRVQQLTGEARTPPARLTIVQKDTSVSIADDQGHARTFHPDGRLDDLAIGTVGLPTTARWDRGSLVVAYDVSSGRQIRYTYTPAANPARLLVSIRFLERGHEGDEVRLTYEPPDAHARAVLSDAPATSSAPAPASSSAPAPASPALPAPTAPSARPPVLPPGSELRGLITIGTVVEDLTAQGAACGLDQAKIKTTIAGILSAAGFKTDRLGNEESYVLVSVVTSRLPDGTCVSRYDTSLVSDADVTLPYLKGLVALQVPLLREGGMAGGSPAAHAKSVMDALGKSVNNFITQIRAANK